MDPLRVPSEERQPIRNFARFFGAYGVGLSLVTAAVPVVMARWDLVPLFASTKDSLTYVTSLGSYLLVGFIFSKRIKIGRLYFPGRGKERSAYASELKKGQTFSWAPAVLAFLSLVFFFLYLFTLQQAVQRAAYEYAHELPTEAGQPVSIREKIESESAVSKVVQAKLKAFAEGKTIQIIYEQKKAGATVSTSFDVQFPDQETVRALLAGVPSPSIPYSLLMTLFFLGAFLCAASAFVLTGLKEYLQEQLGLTDRELILRPTEGSIRKRFDIDSVPGCYGWVEFSPDDSELKPIFEGPFCTWHNLPPKPEEFDPTNGTVTNWCHVYKEEKTTVKLACYLKGGLSEGDLQSRFDQSAGKVLEGHPRTPARSLKSSLKAKKSAPHVIDE